MLLALYIFIAIYLSWIWIDFYRLLDVYDKSSLTSFIIAFLFGASSPLIVMGISELLLPFHFVLNGDFVNDMVYAIFKIGLLEELSKFVMFLLFFALFRKHFREPLDYLAFISAVALGFAATENVMYFSTTSANTIFSRGTFCTLGHMVDTSFIAYGIIKYSFSKFSKWWPYILLAALSHGLYDFWLLTEVFGVLDFVVTLFFFLITISMFATALNNAINTSPHFSYKKIIHTENLNYKLFVRFGFVPILVLAAGTLELGFDLGFRIAAFCFIPSGLILIVCINRLTNLKFIQGHWENIKISLPFFFSYTDASTGEVMRAFEIAGNAIEDSHINQFIESYVNIVPISQRNSYLETTRLLYIEKILFTEFYENVYICKVFIDGKDGKFERMAIMLKHFGQSTVAVDNPIVSLMQIDESCPLDQFHINFSHLSFEEWAYLDKEPRAKQANKIHYHIHNQF